MRVPKVTFGVILFLLVFVCGPLRAASLAGGLVGTIQDSRGTPLDGISVTLLEGQFSSKVVKTTITDSAGRFEIKGLLPGLYALKVIAANYPPLFRSGIKVVADKIASLDLTLENLYLQSILGITRKQQPAVEKEDIESVLRSASSTRPILRVFESESKPDAGPSTSEGVEESANTERGFRGSFRVYASSYDGDPDVAGVGGTFTEFAIAKQLNPNTSLVLAGAVSGSGYAEVDSLVRFADSNGFHNSTVRISMGMLPYLPDTYTPLVSRNAGRMNVYNLELQDEIRLPLRLSLLYGTEIQLSDPAVNSPRVRPKLGAHFRPTSKTSFTYLRTSSLPHLEKVVELEEGKTVTLSMPFQHEYGYPLSLGASRILHSEFSAEQELSSHSRIAAGYYSDRLSPYNQSSFIDSTLEPTSTSRGVRVAYQHRFSPRLEGLFGYTYGGGVNLTGVNDFISSQNFHVLTADLRARIPSTGTYISTIYRWISGDPITLIDPYQENFDSASPGVSIAIAQAIPYVGRFIPGRLEAQFDVQNLLAKNSPDVYSSPYIRRIEFIQPSRSVRGGLMLKF